MGALPTHLIFRMTATLLAAIAIPFLTAGLISSRNDPVKVGSVISLRRTYAFYLILSLVCALFAAYLLLFIGMTLTDSGVC